MTSHHLTLIAAIGKDRALGKNGDLLWKIPADLKRFRERTASHPVIMGRKTWESLPEAVRPMPGRTNIVITRQAAYAAPGASVVSSIEDALKIARSAPGAEEIFVIGGGDIYAAALPFATRLDLTLIDGEKEADAFFPPYETVFTKILANEPHDYEGTHYTYLTLERA